MPSIAENDCDNTIPTELQLHAWKRLASELQNQLNDNNKSSISENIIEEMESTTSADTKSVVLSETDHFIVRKKKKGGDSRKRYHEAVVEDLQLQEFDVKFDGGSRKSKKKVHSMVSGKRKSDRLGEIHTEDDIISKSKAAPPQSKSKRQKKSK